MKHAIKEAATYLMLSLVLTIQIYQHTQNQAHQAELNRHTHTMAAYIQSHDCIAE